MVTYPLEHVRGRYTLGLYTQMKYCIDNENCYNINEYNTLKQSESDIDNTKYLNLIANNRNEYESIVCALLDNQQLRNKISIDIAYKFKYNLHQGGDLAKEWMLFFIRSYISINFV